MTDEQLEQLSQAELLKLFIEKSNQVQDLQARLTIAEAQLSSLGLIQDHVRAAHSPQWEEAIREKLEQLAKAQADLQALLSKPDEPEAETEEPAAPEESAEEPQPEEPPVEEAAAEAESAEETEETNEEAEETNEEAEETNEEAEE